MGVVIMQINKEQFLIIATQIKKLNNKRSKEAANQKKWKKSFHMCLYDRSFHKLDKFSKENGLNRTQTIESLIELLPYIDLF
ncbi:hypothetical protein [Cetobacterium sp.]|uniref:hypothetical protein n=1 Tax=Cetobacterium sp. TaxID=2071632 RepID=UPI003F2E9E53